MKKIINILLIFTLLTFTMSTVVFSEDLNEEIQTQDINTFETLLSIYLEKLGDNMQLKQKFLDMVIEKESLGIIIDETILDKIIEEINLSELPIDIPSKSMQKSNSRSNQSMSRSPMIAAGNCHTVYLKGDGTVWTWGQYSPYFESDTTFEAFDIPTQLDNLTSIVEVAAGGSHSLALKNDGTVWGWGDNRYFQLGTTSCIETRIPIEITGLNSIIAISAGYAYNLALKSDGTVWGWGANWDGELGNGTYTDSITPVQVKGVNNQGYLTDIIQIYCGGFHSIALKSDGTVWTWGANWYGQLGDGTSTDRITPVQVKGVNNQGYLTGITAVSAAGEGHSLALKSDGTVYAWGYNWYGQLGINSSNYSLLPVQVRNTADNGYLTDIIAIEAGYEHSLALENDGSVWVWGNNSNGILGDGTSYERKTPIKLDTISNAVSIAAGVRHNVILKNDGSIWVVGENDKLQHGNGTKIKSNQAQMVYINDGIKDISAGDSHSLALKNDGTILAWGSNNSGILGIGTNQNTSTPTRVIAEDGVGYFSNVKAISAGNNYSIALKEDGSVWAWGINYYGQLGDETTTLRINPVRVKISGTEFLDNIDLISAGNNFSIALKNDGTVWAWGNNSYGQLGDNTTTSRNTAVQVKINANTYLEDIKAISAGENFVTALKEDGSVWAWGNNSYGQLGDNTTTSRNTAAKVKNNDGSGFLEGITSIAVGNGHCIAMKNNGNVLSWGYNGYGQLGDGTTITAKLPIIVKSDINSNLSDIKEVAAGNNFTIAIKNNDTVWSWGRNNCGQLGNGTEYNNNFPTQVKSSGITDYIINVQNISSKGNHVLALRSDNTLWAWGYNNSCQLGDGLTIPSSLWSRVISPVSNTIATATGYNISLALNSDGSVWVTGYNYTNSNNPIQIRDSSGNGYLTDIISIATQYLTCIALKSDGTVWTWWQNTDGQLGNNTLTNSNNPVQVLGAGGVGYLTDIVAISSGDSFCVALKNDGTVWAWGDNKYTQLGNNYTSDYYTPVQVKINSTDNLTGITAISSGSQHTIALKNDGTVWAWGDGSSGQLGDGSYSKSYIAKQMKISSSIYLTGIKAISSGSAHSLALKNDGTIWSSGNNGMGQCGTGSGSSTAYMLQVQGNLNNVASIFAAYNSSFAIKSDGTLWAWGSNNRGVLGDKTTTNRTLPVLTDIVDVKSVSGNMLFALLLKNDGTVHALGENGNAQFGNGTKTTAYYTTPIPAFTNGVKYDDYSDEFLKAAGILPNQTIMGEINNLDDIDCFVYTGNLDDTFKISTTGNINAELYDSNLQIISPISGSYEQNAGTIYYLLVTGQIGEYTFKIEQTRTPIYINTPTFLSGLNGEVITSLTSGFIHVKYGVKNDLLEDKSTAIVLVLYRKYDNALCDIAILEKLFKQDSFENINVGLNVPSDYENYRIELMVWDSIDAMNIISNKFTFE